MAEPTAENDDRRPWPGGCVAHPTKALRKCIGCGRMLGPFWWADLRYSTE